MRAAVRPIRASGRSGLDDERLFEQGLGLLEPASVDRQAPEQRDGIGGIGTDRERPPGARGRLIDPADRALGHRMGRMQWGVLGSDLESGSIGRLGSMHLVDREQRIAEMQIRFRQASVELDRVPTAIDGGSMTP